ncbi:hypothetical protein AB837_00084 [bacterium AB1]|nr:hypothetical protein AB837_00084 [bacterium AB1]
MILEINALAKEVDLDPEIIMENAINIIKPILEQDLNYEIDIINNNNKIIIKNKKTKKDVNIKNISRNAIVKIKKSIIQFINNTRKEKREKNLENYINTLLVGKILSVSNGKVNVICMDNSFILSKKAFNPADFIENNRKYVFLLYYDTTLNKYCLTRNNENFITQIFMANISEIENKSLQIEKIYRIPGIRTVVIINNVDNIRNSVSKCIGYSGERLKSIMYDLSGEKIIFFDKKQPLVKQVTYFFRLDSAQYNIIVSKDSEYMKIYVESNDIKSRIIHNTYMLKLWEEINGLKLKIILIENKDHIMDMIRDSCNIHEKSVLITVVSLIKNISDLYNIKPSHMKINMLISEEKIKLILTCLINQTYDYFELNDKFIKNIIQEDVSIRELYIKNKENK